MHWKTVCIALFWTFSVSQTAQTDSTTAIWKTLSYECYEDGSVIVKGVPSNYGLTVTNTRGCDVRSSGNEEYTIPADCLYYKERATKWWEQFSTSYHRTTDGDYYYRTTGYYPRYTTSYEPYRTNWYYPYRTTGYYPYRTSYDPYYRTTNWYYPYRTTLYPYRTTLYYPYPTTLYYPYRTSYRTTNWYYPYRTTLYYPYRTSHRTTNWQYPYRTTLYYPHRTSYNPYYRTTSSSKTHWYFPFQTTGDYPYETTPYNPYYRTTRYHPHGTTGYHPYRTTQYHPYTTTRYHPYRTTRYHPHGTTGYHPYQTTGYFPYRTTHHYPWHIPYRTTTNSYNYYRTTWYQPQRTTQPPSSTYVGEVDIILSPGYGYVVGGKEHFEYTLICDSEHTVGKMFQVSAFINVVSNPPHPFPTSPYYEEERLRNLSPYVRPVMTIKDERGYIVYGGAVRVGQLLYVDITLAGPAAGYGLQPVTCKASSYGGNEIQLWKIGDSRCVLQPYLMEKFDPYLNGVRAPLYAFHFNSGPGRVDITCKVKVCVPNTKAQCALNVCGVQNDEVQADPIEHHEIKVDFNVVHGEPEKLTYPEKVSSSADNASLNGVLLTAGLVLSLLL